MAQATSKGNDRIEVQCVFHYHITANACYNAGVTCTFSSDVKVTII